MNREQKKITESKSLDSHQKQLSVKIETLTIGYKDEFVNSRNRSYWKQFNETQTTKNNIFYNGKDFYFVELAFKLNDDEQQLKLSCIAYPSIRKGTKIFVGMAWIQLPKSLPLSMNRSIVSKVEPTVRDAVAAEHKERIEKMLSKAKSKGFAQFLKR
ncbi:MAG: hypothetical protein WA999_06290 [Spirulinaceae cyanobacterium]